LTCSTLVGEEETTGKSLGTDLEQQKLTLPLIHLLHHANGTGSRVRQILSSPGNHKREALLPILGASDAVEYARRKAIDFAAQARADLCCLQPSIARGIWRR